MKIFEMEARTGIIGPAIAGAVLGILLWTEYGIAGAIIGGIGGLFVGFNVIHIMEVVIGNRRQTRARKTHTNQM